MGKADINGGFAKVSYAGLADLFPIGKARYLYVGLAVFISTEDLLAFYIYMSPADFFYRGLTDFFYREISTEQKLKKSTENTENPTESRQNAPVSNH